MEPLTSAKRLMLIAGVVALTATAGLLAYRHLSKAPFGHMLRNGLPMLDVSVVLRDMNKQNIDAAATFLGTPEEAPATDERCPALTGGDSGSATILAGGEPRPADCPQRAIWYVKKHPIAFTLYFNRGDTVLKWWENDAQAKAWQESRFMQGLFFGLLKSMKIKAEQLNLQGLQGEFLGLFLRDTIAANAELHYDMVHGDQGWVLSYVRGNSDFAEKALPAMAGLLAGNGYRIAKLPEPVVELRIGLQHFFLTEYQERIYLAQSLEALLNVLESINPNETHADTPISLTLRGEAFVERLLPVLTGTPTATIELAFSLDQAQPGAVRLPAGPWVKPLHPQIFEGVIASIPHDAFAGVAASFLLPPATTIDDWRKLSNEGPALIQPGPEPGGLALIWDFTAESPSGAVGIAIANPAEPQASPAYRQYLHKADLGDECAGGSVFLAASSQSLLTRMKEACNRQSLSPLDWQRGQEKQRFLSSQILAFINPGSAMRELFLAGGAGDSEDHADFAPRWQQDYEKAKAAMRQDGDKLFYSLPIFSYAGRAAGTTVILEGKTVKQEAAQ